MDIYFERAFFYRLLLSGVGRECVAFELAQQLFQILKPSEKKAKYQYQGINSGRPATPQRTAVSKGKK